MKIGDVFANEVVHFCRVRAPPFVEVLTFNWAPFARRSNVANGGIEPNIKELTRLLWNLKAEIGRGPWDVPISQRLPEKIALQVIRDTRFQVFAGLRPRVEELVLTLDVYEKMFGRSKLWSSTT